MTVGAMKFSSVSEPPIGLKASATLDSDNRPITDGDTAAPDPVVGLKDQGDPLQHKPLSEEARQQGRDALRSSAGKPAQGERLDPHTLERAAQLADERASQWDKANKGARVPSDYAQSSQWEAETIAAAIRNVRGDQ